VSDTVPRDHASAGPDATPLRIFVGVDDSQLVAFRVLEYSIRKSASIPVEVEPMFDYPGQLPRSANNRSRTAFSFCRFTIPERCGYEGRALYLDADMLVLGDVAELAALDFGPHAVLRSQSHVSRSWDGFDTIDNFGAQAAVMLLDCSRLRWHADAIVAGLDAGRYSYEELMAGLCIVDPADVADAIPAAWNDLEHYDRSSTKLVHFTVVPTQPWKTDVNPLDALWRSWYREAVAAGAVPPQEVEALVAAGQVKGSLADDLAGAPVALAPGIVSLDGQIETVALRRRVDDLEAQLGALRRSSSWRIGSAITRTARAPARLARRLLHAGRST
jgi:hypothetical protein